MMNKTQLINYFIKLRNYNRYLEITMHNDQENFVHILCADKKNLPSGSVDSSKRTANDNNEEKYGIIFIDGIHTEEQVIKDVSHAYHCLSKNGVIIIHDCMPPDAWHQREMEDFREGENWTGTVWKAALRIYNDTTYRCVLLDTDWGCGVIDTAHTQVPKCLALPGNLDYAIHYPCLLEYRQDIFSYLREQVKVFYHLACMGNWKDVFKEQMFQLAQNDFRIIDMIFLGTEKDLDTVNSICEKMTVRVNILFLSSELTYFEKPALQAIEKYALDNEGYVLYIHSKGVSNPRDETKIKWRRLMMQELVENWRHCVLQLPYYDIIGVNWREMPPISHFCGNFWYASTRYLRKLENFNLYYQNPRYQIWDAVDSKRLGCEFWISSGIERPSVLSLFCRNEDFCNIGYWKNKCT